MADVGVPGSPATDPTLLTFIAQLGAALSEMGEPVSSVQDRLTAVARAYGAPGADFERRITPQYLEGLIEAYRTFFHEYSEAPLLVVNCSAIDFVEQGSDLADLIREIRGVKQGVQHYIPLGSQ